MLKFSNKPLIIYESHRNIVGIVKANKARYRFLNSKYLVRLSKILCLVYFGVQHKNIIFGKLVYSLLRLIKPDFIIACNWTTVSQKTYFEYSKNNTCCFMVVQHGSYVGGVVTVDDHKYMQCDKFLVWGGHFKKLFSIYNSNRDSDIIIFGNPVYNNLSRSEFAYPLCNNNILVAFSYMDEKRLHAYTPIFKQLQKKHTNLFVKYHNMQRNKFEHASSREIKGDFASIVNHFDLIIVDHSTVMIDAIFFKKNVIYVKHDREINVYDAFLKNNYTTIKTNGYTSIDSLVNQEAQERLFQYMATLKDNDLASVL